MTEPKKTAYDRMLDEFEEEDEEEKTGRTHECGFCGEEFDTPGEKLAHQKNNCEEMPRTRSD